MPHPFRLGLPERVRGLILIFYVSSRHGNRLQPSRLNVNSAARYFTAAQITPSAPSERAEQAMVVRSARRRPRAKVGRVTAVVALRFSAACREET